MCGGWSGWNRRLMCDGTLGWPGHQLRWYSLFAKEPIGGGRRRTTARPAEKPGPGAWPGAPLTETPGSPAETQNITHI